MKQIPLTQGKFALVDDEDFDFLSSWKWQMCGNGCASRNSSRKFGKQTKILMHRVIMDCPDGMVVDHVNNDRLDNRRGNLRICTQSENSMNRTTASTNKCGYKGVYWHKGKRKWYAHITINGKQKYIGMSHDINEAARMYNEKAKELFGDFAKLNDIHE